MRKGRWLAGLLTSALLVGYVIPAMAVNATEIETENVKEIQEETENLSEELLIEDETESQSEMGVEENMKGAGVDENGFMIDENGTLTGYFGSGGDITIPDGVTSIGDSAFDKSGCYRVFSIISIR